MKKEGVHSCQGGQIWTAEFRHFSKMLTKALHTDFEHLSTLEDEKVLMLVVYARARLQRKRQVWCIEDAAGICLKHLSSLQGDGTGQGAAVTLADAMIPNGEIVITIPPSVRITGRSPRSQIGRKIGTGDGRIAVARKSTSASAKSTADGARKTRANAPGRTAKMEPNR